jgi:hypothetical protein
MCYQLAESRTLDQLQQPAERCSPRLARERSPNPETPNGREVRLLESLASLFNFALPYRPVVDPASCLVRRPNLDPARRA